MNGISIKLHKADANLFGKSKWWGDPDLPKDMDFPTYVDSDGEEYQYVFLCQIRCKDLIPYDLDNLLPHKGMLFFFARIDYYLGYDATPEGLCVWDQDYTRVVYVEDYDPDKASSLILVDDDNKPVSIKARAINFSIGNSDGHKLLGDPYFYPFEERDPFFEGWVNLLQVDSDEDDDFVLNFMDTGLMFFMINSKDLESRNFDNVRGTMVSM